jgi:hypothetical protein
MKKILVLVFVVVCIIFSGYDLYAQTKNKTTQKKKNVEVVKQVDKVMEQYLLMQHDINIKILTTIIDREGNFAMQAFTIKAAGEATDKADTLSNLRERRELLNYAQKLIIVDSSRLREKGTLIEQKGKELEGEKAKLKMEALQYYKGSPPEEFEKRWNDEENITKVKTQEIIEKVKTREVEGK